MPREKGKVMFYGVTGAVALTLALFLTLNLMTAESGPERLATGAAGVAGAGGLALAVWLGQANRIWTAGAGVAVGTEILAMVVRAVGPSVVAQIMQQ